jgi:hypothetical protein
MFKLVKLDAKLSCHACQFKFQNVSKIIYQDLSGSKFATVFLTISRISAGVHRYYGGQIPKNSTYRVTDEKPLMLYLSYSSSDLNK